MILRKLLSVALLPAENIAEAFLVLQNDASGTVLAPIVNQISSSVVHDVFSCHNTSRAKDAAIGYFLQQVYKVTTGHPRPVIWTYIGEDTGMKIELYCSWPVITLTLIPAAFRCSETAHRCMC